MAKMEKYWVKISRQDLTETNKLLNSQEDASSTGFLNKHLEINLQENIANCSKTPCKNMLHKRWIHLWNWLPNSVVIALLLDSFENCIDSQTSKWATEAFSK
jgi:hypothetical protein